jgi:uncharacterized protein
VDIIVIHDMENERFVADINGDKAYAAYNLEGDIIKLYSTFTPQHLRGRGIAKTIVETVFKYAMDNNLKVQPICSYVRSFISQNREYSDFVAN